MADKTTFEGFFMVKLIWKTYYHKKIKKTWTIPVTKNGKFGSLQTLLLKAKVCDKKIKIKKKARLSRYVDRMLLQQNYGSPLTLEVDSLGLFHN